MLIDTFLLELFQHSDHWQSNGELFTHDGFFMLRNFSISNREFLIPSQPYRLKEGRVVLVKQGSATYSFNLVNHTFVAGDLVVFHADTLIEKQGHSPDFQFDAFNFPSDIFAPSQPPPSGKEQSLSRASHHAPRTLESLSLGGAGGGFLSSYHCLHMDEETAVVVRQHFALLWLLVHTQPFSHENVHLIVRSLLQFAASRNMQTHHATVLSRQEDTLRRFIALVSQHAAKERNVPFYADRLCMAPHYLSTLVKQTSGKTVMQWINETAVKEIKVWLGYSNETAAQIALHLNFPSPSSLNKFFKRETGLTPGEYRNQLTNKKLTS